MKITVEIGPNKVTRFLSRVRYSVVSAVSGLREGWRGYQPRSKPTKVGKLASQT
jgi:hypothetical protein